MPDAFPTRLAVRAEFVSAVAVQGTDRLLITVRTATNERLSLRLTQAEAAELMALIIAERPRVDDGAVPVQPSAAGRRDAAIGDLTPEA